MMLNEVIRLSSWVVDSKLEGNPTLITVSGSEYGDGEIFMSQKGRGLGDCWGRRVGSGMAQRSAKAVKRPPGCAAIFASAEHGISPPNGDRG